MHLTEQSNVRRFTIATARPQDAAALARVHVEGWRAAYGHLLSDHEKWFGAAALERRARQWTQWLTPGTEASAFGTYRAGYDEARSEERRVGKERRCRWWATPGRDNGM